MTDQDIGFCFLIGGIADILYQVTFIFSVQILHHVIYSFSVFILFYVIKSVRNVQSASDRALYICYNNVSVPMGFINTNTKLCN